MKKIKLLNLPNKSVNLPMKQSFRSDAYANAFRQGRRIGSSTPFIIHDEVIEEVKGETLAQRYEKLMEQHERMMLNIFGSQWVPQNARLRNPLLPKPASYREALSLAETLESSLPRKDIP